MRATVARLAHDDQRGISQMSFFLLGKGADGTLSLLSDAAFESRQDALAELSRITSSLDFGAWDSEVLVIDLDAGTPVLLVRPTAPDTEIVAEPPAADEDEPPVDEALVAVLEDLETDETPTVAAEQVEDSPEDAFVAEAEDAFVAEAEDAPVVEVDEAWAAAVGDSESASGDSLKGALKRTAAQMEAQGISAPASVGPAAESSAAVVAEVAEAIEVPGPTDETPETEAEPAPAPAEAAPEPDEEPLDDAEAADEVAPDDGADSPDEAPAWPWDTVTDASTPLSALEEPGLDTESMIRALAEDESSRTVVLGEYDGSDIASTEPELLVSAASVEAPEVTAAPTPVPEMPVEPASVLEIEPAVAETPEPPLPIPEPASLDAAATPPVTASPESDFVDLGQVDSPEVKTYEPGEIDISGMTCNDCVYFDTCPNKDERIPATCGSFQWK